VYTSSAIWTAFQQLTTTGILKFAPNLRTLELRAAKIFRGSNSWPKVISQLTPLKNLSKLILSFTRKEKPMDAESIIAARVLLQQSAVAGATRLVIRRVSNLDGTDLVHSLITETFDSEVVD
jgi:hypothetical protein